MHLCLLIEKILLASCESFYNCCLVIGTIVSISTCSVSCLPYLNDMKSSSFANVITLLDSSFGTGNKYFSILFTCLDKMAYSYITCK